jgi:hypothetical protein
VKPLTAVSGKSRLLCAAFRTEAHRRRRVAEPFASYPGNL